MKSIVCLGVAFCFILLFSSCNKKETNLQPSNEITEHTAIPTQTDPNITTSTAGNLTQYAYLPKQSNARKDKLFVFLPGTFVGPNVYTKILQVGAEKGYYSMGIAYSNNQTIQSFCNGNDQSCASNIFREYLEGGDFSPAVTINQTNALQNRIAKFILYLQNNYPDENWGRFLNADRSIKWEKISLAGHSQGSGHTLYISKVRNLARASLFSGPNGFKLANGQFPNWIAAVGLTTNDKVFAFSNTLDAIADWAELQTVFAEIKLIGAIQSVDNVTNFNNSHRLFTSIDLAPALINPEHGSTVANENTPIDSQGKAKFEAVWQYMCFPD